MAPMVKARMIGQRVHRAILFSEAPRDERLSRIQDNQTCGTGTSAWKLLKDEEEQTRKAPISEMLTLGRAPVDHQPNAGFISEGPGGYQVTGRENACASLDKNPSQHPPADKGLTERRPISAPYVGDD